MKDFETGKGGKKSRRGDATIRGLADKEPKRPFQAAPVEIDMTEDIPFELSWNPIMPAATRVRNEDKKGLDMD